jgi:hypothetical protein
MSNRAKNADPIPREIGKEHDMSNTTTSQSIARSARNLRSDRAAWRHLPFLAGMLTATALVTIRWMADGSLLDLQLAAVAATIASTIWIAYAIMQMGSRVHFDRSQGAAIVSYFCAAAAVIATTGYGNSSFFPMLAVPLLWLTSIGERLHVKGGILCTANVLLLPALDSHWQVADSARLEYGIVAALVVVLLSVICLPCNHMVRYLRYQRYHSQVAETAVEIEAHEHEVETGWLILGSA